MRPLLPSGGLEPWLHPAPPHPNHRHRRELTQCARRSSLPGEKLDYKACEALEEVFKRLQFKVVDLEQTNLDEDVSTCHRPSLLLSSLALRGLGLGHCRRREPLGQGLGRAS